MTVRRLFLTAPILFGTTVFVFLILRLVPGDPAAAVLGANATQESVRQVNEQLGLQRPLLVQFGEWFSGLLHGDLGHDYVTNQSINAQMANRLPTTLELVALAFLTAVLVAVPAGALAAYYRDGWLDRAVRGFSLLSIAIPDFVFGILAILLFALTLGLFPTSGFVPITESASGNLKTIALPAAALALGLVGVLARVTRSAMLEVLHTDYIRLSRSQGHGTAVIIFRYALRNAAVPVVTVAGLQLGYLIGGTVVVEDLFAIPGVGQLLVQSVLSRNYPVVQVCALVFSGGFIVVNLGCDLMYAVLNPRLRRGHA